WAVAALADSPSANTMPAVFVKMRMDRYPPNMIPQRTRNCRNPQTLYGTWGIEWEMSSGFFPVRKEKTASAVSSGGGAVDDFHLHIAGSPRLPAVDGGSEAEHHEENAAGRKTPRPAANQADNQGTD